MCSACQTVLAAVDVKKCGRCKVAVYCAEDCAAAAWPEHKTCRKGLTKLTLSLSAR